MDKDKDDEFNERILTALKKQIKNSDSKFAGLEKNLAVKEAELQYLVTLYDEKISSLTLELEDEKKRANKLEEQMNEVTGKLSVKEEEIINLTSKVDNLDNAITSKDNNVGVLDSKVSDLHNIISHQEAKIHRMDEEFLKKEEILARQLSRIEAIELELKEFKQHEIFAGDTSGGERLKCPKCGATGKDIKLVEDKARPLSYVGNMPMYAKIKVCKKCRHSF